MDTLPNVNTRRGGKDPSHIGLTSNVSPKVQSPQAENSHTGVSSFFVPKPNGKWFALRATYGRNQMACEELNKKEIQTYMPMHKVAKIISGKKRFVKEPLLPNIIFAYGTREEMETFVKQPAVTARYLKYYLNKTKPIELTTGLHPPLVVPDTEMCNFIRLTSVDNEHIMAIEPSRCHYRSGDTVRIIKGQFKGIIGKVARAAGQQRIAIEIGGLCTIVTAYIPSDFIEPISKGNHDKADNTKTI